MNNLINKIKLLIKEEPNIALKDKNKIKILLESSEIDINDIKKFVKIDETINYTRNLISTDNKSYALILIWWNKGKYSPIHDHPSDGCWVKIISGTVNEIQYECKNNKLIEISNKINKDDLFVFISSGHGSGDGKGNSFICCLDINTSPNGKYTDKYGRLKKEKAPLF